MASCDIGVKRAVRKILNNDPIFKFNEESLVVNIVSARGVNVDRLMSKSLAQSLSSTINSVFNAHFSGIGTVAFPINPPTGNSMVKIYLTNKQFNIMSSRFQEIEKEKTRLSFIDVDKMLDDNRNVLNSVLKAMGFDIKKGFKLSVDKLRKDQGKANYANAYIGFPIEGRSSSTGIYLEDAKKQGIPVNDEIVPNENTIAFVSVASEGTHVEKTAELAKKVIEAGGTVIMDAPGKGRGQSHSPYNIKGEGAVQDILGKPSGRTKEGYNYWGKDPSRETLKNEDEKTAKLTYANYLNENPEGDPSGFIQWLSDRNKSIKEGENALEVLKDQVYSELVEDDIYDTMETDEIEDEEIVEYEEISHEEAEIMKIEDFYESLPEPDRKKLGYLNKIKEMYYQSLSMPINEFIEMLKCRL